MCELINKITRISISLLFLKWTSLALMSEMGETSSLDPDPARKQADSTSITDVKRDPSSTLDTTVENTEPLLSKRALKRKLKHEKWLKWRPLKRAKEKEKMKIKKQYAREHNIPMGPSRKALKLVKMENSANKLRVCIDFSFDDLMTPKDIAKCVKQLNRCYSLNRRAQNPLQFYVANFKDKCKEEIERYNGYNYWDVHIHPETYLNLFNKEDVIYLTSDSDNTIQDLDSSKVYIIGGLVDHNKHKLLTLNKARSEGIAHGKLPIGTYLNMKSRHVLTVNHVFEILLAVSSEGKSWAEALLQALPERKNAAEKSQENGDTALPLVPSEGKNDEEKSQENGDTALPQVSSERKSDKEKSKENGDTALPQVSSERKSDKEKSQENEDESLPEALSESKNDLEKNKELDNSCKENAIEKID